LHTYPRESPTMKNDHALRTWNAKGNPLGSCLMDCLV
jgi:hypothetical protein